MKDVQNEVVEETTPVVNNEEAAEETAVTQAPVAESEVTESESAPQEGKKSRVALSDFLFNLISLCVAAFLLVADIYLLIAMNTGIFKIGDMPFTATAITTYVQRLSAIGFQNLVMDAEKFGGLYVFVMYAVVYIVFWINILIGVIKSIIKIFGFFKLKRERSETELAFSKYVKTVCKNYGLGIILVAMSLFAADSLTGVGVGVVVFGTIIYVGLAVFKQLFITPVEPEGSLFSKIVNMVTELGRRAVMLMVGFLLVANITPCLSNFLSGLDEFIYTAELLFDEAEGVMDIIPVMYTGFLREILLIIPFALIVSIAGKIAKWYVFNNGKKDVNGGLFRDFVALFVISLILCIADCVMLGMAGLDGVGAMVQSYIGILLASVAGAVIAFVSRDKSVVVAR